MKRRSKRSRPRIDAAAWLEEAYRRYHRREHVYKDPLVFLYDYPAADREIVGLIASSLAYGRVASILRGVGGVLKVMTPSPRAYLKRRSEREIRRDFSGFRYRVTGEAEMTAMLVGLRRLLASHGSVERVMVGRGGDEATVTPALGRLVEAIAHAGGHPLHHILPHPCRGSACKRLMLYLRWMVRRDAIDPGGWNVIRPASLIIPLDTHVHHVSGLLGLTTRNQANLRTAEEITAALRAICPEDPLRYDFAMTRPGILGESGMLGALPEVAAKVG